MAQNRADPTLSRMGSESNKEPKPDIDSALYSHLTSVVRPWNAKYDY